MLAGIQFRSAAIRLCFLWNAIFQSRHSACYSVALSSVAVYMPISRYLRQQMLSDLMLLILSVWPLAHNVDWTQETSRPFADRPGLWASILPEHIVYVFIQYVRCIFVCVSVAMHLSECTAYHLALGDSGWDVHFHLLKPPQKIG